MSKAINDSTLNKIGDIYHYLIALKDCFELNEGDVLQIELNGDVSLKNNDGGLFQKEVKHHYCNSYLSDRSVDFWKTVANWYEDYERIKIFSHLILWTTATVSEKSSFYNWNRLEKNEKLKQLKNIGKKRKGSEQIFRNQYDRIFNECLNEQNLLDILDKFTIELGKTNLAGISNEFSKYIGHIPVENKDGYIGALLGHILIRVKDPPHKWEVTRKDFDEMLQLHSSTFGISNTAPLPTIYEKRDLPEKEIDVLEQKKFVLAIREIEYDDEIPCAMSDYWKANMTIVEYFHDNIMYLQSLESYEKELTSKMKFYKNNSKLEFDESSGRKQLTISKKLYNDVMSWDVKDFGSIIRNQGFFQRGVIHSIVDETDFRWKVGDEKNEY